MNFIITMKCNKGCPYCFASESRKNANSNLDMTLETFDEMLSKLSPNDSIKLLGGEPTQHPQFKEIYEKSINSKNPLTLISNFLFNDEVLNVILDNIRKKPISMLINSTDLDKLNRLEIFKKNYNAIYDKLYEIDSEQQMSVGITFDRDKDWKYYIQYLEELSHHIHIESLRLSIPNPDKNKGDFFFINNKDFGKKFLSCIRWAIDKDITPRLDCIIYPCMFESKEEWKIITKFLGNMRTVCGDACPNDVFPDKTASFCYPVKENIKVDSNKYKNSGQIIKDMTLRYRILESKMKLPEDCKQCKFRDHKMCNGPCLAFYDLSGEDSGINI